MLRPEGRVLCSAHEGQGETEVEEFLGEEVCVPVTFFDLEDLVAAMRAAGFEIMCAERRAPYSTESERFRLYVEAKRLPPRS